METTNEVLEVIDPEFVQFLVRSGGLQKGDWVRFSPQCDIVVSIPKAEAGKWHRVKPDGKLRVWRGVSSAPWVFHEVHDAAAIDGWRRRVK